MTKKTCSEWKKSFRPELFLWSREKQFRQPVGIFLIEKLQQVKLLSVLSQKSSQKCTSVHVN